VLVPGCWVLVKKEKGKRINPLTTKFTKEGTKDTKSFCYTDDHREATESHRENREKVVSINTFKGKGRQTRNKERATSTLYPLINVRKF
jgi:hypothetical protein